MIQAEEDVSTTGEHFTPHQHGLITSHVALLRTHPTGEQRLAVRLSHVPAPLRVHLSVNVLADLGPQT